MGTPLIWIKNFDLKLKILFSKNKNNKELKPNAVKWEESKCFDINSVKIGIAWLGSMLVYKLLKSNE